MSKNNIEAKKEAYFEDRLMSDMRLKSIENAHGAGFDKGYEFCQKEYEEKLRWIPVEEKLPEIREEQYIIETMSSRGSISHWIISNQYDIDMLRDFRVSWRYRIS